MRSPAESLVNSLGAKFVQQHPSKSSSSSSSAAAPPPAPGRCSKLRGAAAKSQSSPRTLAMQKRSLLLKAWVTLRGGLHQEAG